MANVKRLAATSAAVAILAAGGALPAQAAARPARSPVEPAVGSVFSGVVDESSADSLLVERKRRGGDSTLVLVDTDRETVVSRGGLAKSVGDLSQGSEVIVSGTKQGDGSVLASKIIIRG